MELLDLIHSIGLGAVISIGVGIWLHHRGERFRREDRERRERDERIAWRAKHEAEINHLRGELKRQDTGGEKLAEALHDLATSVTEGFSKVGKEIAVLQTQVKKNGGA